MYALHVNGKKNTKKTKGIKNNVVAKSITFDDYMRYLFDKTEMTRKQSCIRSKLHEVYTIFGTKITLSPYDDKRYIMLDSTLCHGDIIKYRYRYVFKNCVNCQILAISRKPHLFFCVTLFQRDTRQD